MGGLRAAERALGHPQRGERRVVQRDPVAPEGASGRKQALAQRTSASSSSVPQRASAISSVSTGAISSSTVVARKTCVAPARGPAVRYRNRARASTRYRSSSTWRPVSSNASRRTASTNSSPGLTPPPGGRQMSRREGVLADQRDCSAQSGRRIDWPLRMKSVTSWSRAGLYVAMPCSRSLISPSHSSTSGSP